MGEQRIRAPRQRRERRQRPAPWLASDVVRSFAGLSVILAGALLMPWALQRTGLDDSTVQVLAVSLFASWVLFAIAYIAMTLLVFLPADAERFAHVVRATTPQPGWRTVLWVANGGGAVSWALTGSFFAIFSVVLLVTQQSLLDQLIVVVLAVAVVITSWALILVAYAVRYAREQLRSGGLAFGGDEQPRFGDFLYLAVQIATTFASSDVQTTTRRMRGIIAINSIVAFAFNTVIVALLVATLINSAT